MLSINRGIKSPLLIRCMSSKFVILDARQSGIAPRRRRQQDKARSRSSQIVMAEAHQLDRQLLEDQLSAKSQESGSNLLSLVVEQLKKQEPPVKQVSPKQYRELAEQLKRGYTKQQLLHFVNSENAHVPRSSSKSLLVQKILDDIWKVDKSLEELPAGAALVEKTIPLSDRSMFLLLSGSGSLIRTWTKSGARVWLLPEERKLLVRASKETYDWIVASLHNMEENLVDAQVNLKFYRGSTPLDWYTLNTIQRLSEAFFVLEDGLESDTLVIFARDKKNIALALQLLVTIVPQSMWTSRSVLYDVSPESLPNCTFSTFGDATTLSWNEQFSRWSRWEKLKSRDPINLGVPDLQPLNNVVFGEASQTESKSPSEAIIGSLQTQLSKVKTTGAVTITASLGHLLHMPREQTVLPNVAMPKTFGTHIPLVSKVVGELPLNDADVLDDTMDSLDEAVQSANPVEPVEPVESGSDTKEPDLWDLILGAKDNDEKTFTSKRKELVNEVNRMIQIKLVPNPFKEGNLQQKYPPVEVWAAHSHKGIDVDNAKAVCVPHEHDVLVSLPNSLSDLKFSVTNTSELEISPALDRFLHSSFATSDEVKYVPSTVDLDIDGETVEYRLHSVNQRTEIELNFRGTMVQLSHVDGGKLGGRRVDATLVYHEEAGRDAVSSEELEKFASRSLRLVEELDEAETRVGPSLVFNL